MAKAKVRQALINERGYVRVSTEDQITDRQLCGIKFPEDALFVDHRSGKNTDRPGLKMCMAACRKGDILHVHSIDRLARSIIDLERIVKKLQGKGVTIHFHSENIIIYPDGSAEDDPMGYMMFQMLGVFAEFERNIMKKRQKEGIVQCHKRGTKLGRTGTLPEKKARIIQLIKEGASPKAIMNETGVSRTTFYRIQRDYTDVDLTEKQVKKIIKLRKKKGTPSTIAQALGLPRPAVKKVIEEHFVDAQFRKGKAA